MPAATESTSFTLFHLFIEKYKYTCAHSCFVYSLGYVHTVIDWDWQPQLLIVVSLEMSCLHSSLQYRGSNTVCMNV